MGVFRRAKGSGLCDPNRVNVGSDDRHERYGFYCRLNRRGCVFGQFLPGMFGLEGGFVGISGVWGRQSSGVFSMPESRPTQTKGLPNLNASRSRCMRRCTARRAEPVRCVLRHAFNDNQIGTATAFRSGN